MIVVHQRCLLCGIDVPLGFTHCDACYRRVASAGMKILSSLLGEPKGLQDDLGVLRAGGKYRSLSTRHHS